MMYVSTANTPVTLGGGGGGLKAKTKQSVVSQQIFIQIFGTKDNRFSTLDDLTKNECFLSSS